jgi:hypothetical protein
MVDKGRKKGGVQIMTAGDMDASEINAKVMLFGDPGAGKTWAAVTAPKPLVLLTEQNGVTSIRESNPDARIAYVSDIGGVREILSMAYKGELKDMGVRTIVIDSLTEVQRLFKDEIIEQKSADNEFTLRDWSILTEKMRKFMRTIRDLPYHVVCTALAKSELEETTGVRYVVPAFEGKKTAAEVAQYFNAVGYMAKKEVDEDGTKKIIYRAVLEGPSRFMTKPCFPLTGVQEPDMGKWFKALTGGDKSKQRKGEKAE